MNLLEYLKKQQEDVDDNRVVHSRQNIIIKCLNKQTEESLSDRNFNIKSLRIEKLGKP